VRAIILAAGQGTRLMPYTKDRPKCLVELAGKSLLDHQLDRLHRQGIREVAVVTGYHAESLKGRNCKTFYNAEFASTNMVASLMKAQSWLTRGEDILILYGDVLFEQRVLDLLCDTPDDFAITANREWLALWRARMSDPLADAETLKVNDAGFVTEIGKKAGRLEDIPVQYMGMIKASADAARKLVKVYDGLPDTKRKMFMTDFLQHLIDHKWAVHACPVNGGWLEVDTTGDLELYRRLDAEGRLDAFWDKSR